NLIPTRDTAIKQTAQVLTHTRTLSPCLSHHQSVIWTPAQTSRPSPSPDLRAFTTSLTHDPIPRVQSHRQDRLSRSRLRPTPKWISSRSSRRWNRSTRRPSQRVPDLLYRNPH